MDPLGTDSCRGTVPMEPPMSNGSMHHREPKCEIDDTGHFLQGALCTIHVAAMVQEAPCDHTRIIDFTNRFPMLHGSVRHGKFHELFRRR
jgi:hypothetical protein